MFLMHMDTRKRKTLSNAIAQCRLYLKSTGEITMAIIGDNGNNVLNGGSGHDTIVWNNGDGSDTNNGGAGTNTQEVNGANAAGDEFVEGR
jgi:Ca2+-binding RTX toxin-like protein